MGYLGTLMDLGSLDLEGKTTWEAGARYYPIATWTEVAWQVPKYNLGFRAPVLEYRLPMIV
jgi:hypothetical protein